MTRDELIHELDRIIDVGIVNAKHDGDILRHVRKQLKETDLDAFRRILKNCPHMKGKWDVNQEENDKGETVYDVTIRDFSDSVTLCFDENGRLYA